MKKSYLTRMGRRSFIRSAAGATFALPFMPSLLDPKEALAAATGKNFFFMRCGNGVQQLGYNNVEKRGEMNRFWPDALAAQTQLSAALMDKKLSDGRTCALQELKAYRDNLLLVQGVAYHDWKSGTTGCGHAEGGIRCFTASGPQTSGKKNRARAKGISFDWYLYNQFNQMEEWKPLILSSGVNSSYLGPVLSYRTPGTVESPQYNPWSVYKALFGMSGGIDENDRQAQLIADRQNSINDFVRDELRDLVNPRKVSREDWQKLQRHQSAIRDIEKKMTGETCGLPTWEQLKAQFEGKDDRSLQKSELVEQITKIQMDITALSFSCGIRRNVSLQIGNGNDQTVYKTPSRQNGERFHWISHRIKGDGNFEPGKTEVIRDAEVLHHEVDRVFAQWFGYFIDKLKSYQALDNTIAVWTNDLSNGTHHRYNIPYVIAGSGGQSLKNGIMVDYNPNEKNNRNSNKWETHDKLFNTIAGALGVKNAKFGVGTSGGELAAIKK